MRKKGEEHNLAPNSKLSAADFGYANQMASKIYHFLKSVLARPMGRPAYQKVLDKTIALVRADEIHELGSLSLGYGTTGPMQGLQLNDKKTWEGLVHWNSNIELDFVGKYIKIIVPPRDKWLTKTFPNRVSRISVKFHLYKLPINQSDEVDYVSTQALIIGSNEESKQRSVSLSIASWDNCLILVIGTAKSYLWEKDGKGDFLSADRALMAGAILQVITIRDGKLIEERSPVPKKSPPPSPDDGVEWE